MSSSRDPFLSPSDLGWKGTISPARTFWIPKAELLSHLTEGCSRKLINNSSQIEVREERQGLYEIDVRGFVTYGDIFQKSVFPPEFADRVVGGLDSIYRKGHAKEFRDHEVWTSICFSVATSIPIAGINIISNHRLALCKCVGGWSESCACGCLDPAISLFEDLMLFRRREIYPKRHKEFERMTDVCLTAFTPVSGFEGKFNVFSTAVLQEIIRILSFFLGIAETLSSPEISVSSCRRALEHAFWLRGELASRNEVFLQREIEDALQHCQKRSDGGFIAIGRRPCGTVNHIMHGLEALGNEKMERLSFLGLDDAIGEKDQTAVRTARKGILTLHPVWSNWPCQTMPEWLNCHVQLCRTSVIMVYLCEANEYMWNNNFYFSHAARALQAVWPEKWASAEEVIRTPIPGCAKTHSDLT